MEKSRVNGSLIIGYSLKYCGKTKTFAHDNYERFLLLKRCFQKSSAAEASESVCLWEKVKVHTTRSNTYEITMAIIDTP